MKKCYSNGINIKFCPQTPELELLYAKLIVPIKNTTEEVSYEW